MSTPRSRNSGHALGWADFDGDGNDELVVGRHSSSRRFRS
jgi:FG-GAP repeat